MTPQTEKQLARLKDFQRRSVDYVFARMYEDADPALRFLVADEVGLGKTMVARGVISRAIEHLRDRCQVSRVDIIYVCSNAAIAAQNLARLNVLEDDRQATRFATRLSLLALNVHNLDDNLVNFISFTPGTTFDLKSRGGVADERALIYYAFKHQPKLNRDGLRGLLQGTSGDKSWRWQSRRWQSDEEPKPDAHIVQRFVHRVVEDRAIFGRLQTACEDFLSHTLRHESRYALIGRLRELLAEVSLDALEPDLVILDEFQRFKHLLRATQAHGTVTLAQRLFQWRPEMGRHPNDPPPRFLLLSATPYKMYTVRGEAEDAHYADFLQTMAFLMGPDEVVSLRRETRAYRDALQRHIIRDLAEDRGRLTAARDALEKRLRSCMVRTERVGHTRNRDGLIVDNPIELPVIADDIRAGVALDRLARLTQSGDVIDYWKSAPYVLDFMKGYKLIRQLKESVPTAASAWALSKVPVIDAAAVERWRPLPAGNPRARALLAHTLDDAQWQLLWMPPSLPYLVPQGAYAAGSHNAVRAETARAADDHVTTDTAMSATSENGAETPTNQGFSAVNTTSAGAELPSKTLVFSSWNLVPDAIAALTSYEAERRAAVAAQASSRTPLQPYAGGRQRAVSLLHYNVRDESYRGMGALLLEMPCPRLAALGDPLALALAARRPVTAATARERVRGRIVTSLSAALTSTNLHATASHVDAKWYWVAVAAIEAASPTPSFCDGLFEQQWTTTIHAKSAGFAEVARRFFAVLAGGDIALGQQPTDLYDRLTDLALGAPGMCALRSLQRICADEATPAVLLGAARVADGMRTLYNQRDSTRLLRPEHSGSYWRLCAAHGVAGNLQALFDEHMHTLAESLGLQDAGCAERANKISAAIRDSLSLRTANLTVRHQELDHTGAMTTSERIAFRTRFALRFGDLKNADKTVQRADAVRIAFNSPFRPFVLASTSVGQEGLDFHTWCHHVVHWNLPRNPVDMEQREGRVHRYKGLAVRRNVARRFGLQGLADQDWRGRTDPWAQLFNLAKGPENQPRSDLATFWVFDDLAHPSRVRRTVLLPKMSREKETYPDLLKSLALYRLAFGQPRQEELVEWLKDKADEAKIRGLRQWELRLDVAEENGATSTP